MALLLWVCLSLAQGGLPGHQPTRAALAPNHVSYYDGKMLHPLAFMIRRKETAGSMPVSAGIGMVVGGLVASGWMTIATLSHRAWVVGFVAGVIFVVSLLATIGYFFPEDRR